MALSRAHQKVFCDNVIASDNVAVFGSLRSGSSAFSKDPTTIQSLSAFLEGWKSAVVTNNAPALQDVNALFFLLTRQLAYLFQDGIPEWHESTEFTLDSFCKVGGTIYKSLVASNTGNAVTNVSKWCVVLASTSVGGAYGDVPIGAVLATMTHLSGAYSCSSTTAADERGFVLCNGQTISDATSPMNGAVIPNINNNIFLMGTSGTTGTTGGQNSTTLQVSNLPSHDHSIPSHTHTIDHGHTASSSVAGSHSHTLSGNIDAPGGKYAQGSYFYAQFYQSSSAGDHSHTITVSSVTGASGAWSGTSGATGSATALENRPSYISCKYIMRVK